jgi:hypothetical protein
MTFEAVLWGIMSRGTTGLFPGRNGWELPKSILKLFIVQQIPWQNLPAVFRLD